MNEALLWERDKLSVPYNPDAIPGRHTIHYRVRDAYRGYPTRDVEVLATPGEIEAFVCDGYLVREKLLPMETVECLRAALDETYARDSYLEKGSSTFGGVFIRHLMDKHAAFLAFLKFAPTLSIARAVFGPNVAVRGFTGRVCYPDDPNQEVEWHLHQRVISDPLPPWFAFPQTLDVLLYLDDLTEQNGPLCVVPGSHRWIERDLATKQTSDLPEQVTLHLPVGSAVLCHGSLWHRALPTRPGGTMRRLLLWGYGPAWQKPAIYGVKPPDGLTTQVLADNPDEETRELLGVAGYM